jgi:hypothetical protein
MPRLSLLADLNDAPIHGLTDVPLAYFQRTLGLSPCHPASPLALTEAHCNTHCSRLDPRRWQPRHAKTSYTRIPKRAPIHGLLPTDLRWYPGPRTQNRHTTPQLWPHKRPHGHQTTYRHLLSMLVGLRTSTWPLLPFVQLEHSS